MLGNVGIQERVRRILARAMHRGRSVKRREDGSISQEKYDKELEELVKQAYGAEGAEKARAAAINMTWIVLLLMVC